MHAINPFARNRRCPAGIWYSRTLSGLTHPLWPAVTRARHQNGCGNSESNGGSSVLSNLCVLAVRGALCPGCGSLRLSRNRSSGAPLNARHLRLHVLPNYARYQSLCAQSPVSGGYLVLAHPFWVGAPFMACRNACEASEGVRASERVRERGARRQFAWPALCVRAPVLGVYLALAHLSELTHPLWPAITRARCQKRCGNSEFNGGSPVLANPLRAGIKRCNLFGVRFGAALRNRSSDASSDLCAPPESGREQRSATCGSCGSCGAATG